MAHWTSENNSNNQDEFYYDIDIDYDNWLLSGKRRLRFKSKPGEMMEFSLSLVPLKTGNLLLPSVRISAVSTEVFASTVYINSAQQILVKPKSKTATFFVEQQRFLQQPLANNTNNNTLPLVMENATTAAAATARNSIRSGIDISSF